MKFSKKNSSLGLNDFLYQNLNINVVDSKLLKMQGGGQEQIKKEVRI